MIEEFVSTWNNFDKSRTQLKIAVQNLWNTVWYEQTTKIIYKFVDVYQMNGVHGEYKVLMIDLTSDPIPWYKRKYLNEKRPKRFLLVEDFIKMVDNGQLKRLVADKQN